MHLGDVNLHSPRLIEISDLLFPLPVGTRSHAVNQFCSLDALEFFCGHGLDVVIDCHLDCQPSRNNKPGIDSCLPETCPMDVRPFSRCFPSEAKGLFVWSRLQV